MRAWNLRKIAHSLLCFLPWFLAFYCFFAWIVFFSLSSLLDVWFFSIFDFDFSTSSCYFHPVYLVFFFWVVCMWSSRFLWRLVQRTACIWYVRARTSFFMFCLRCRSASESVIVCTALWLFYFVGYFFHSSRVMGSCPATTDCTLLWRWVNVRTTTTTNNKSGWRTAGRPEEWSAPVSISDDAAIIVRMASSLWPSWWLITWPTANWLLRCVEVAAAFEHILKMLCPTALHMIRTYT